MSKNLILLICWPLIIAVSLYIFIKGRNVYKLVRGSMVGQITESLVYSTLVNISCFGIISTLYLITGPKNLYPIAGVFALWLIVLIWSLRTINKVGNEAKKIISQK